MASNKLPSALTPLLNLADDLADGLHSHGDTVGVKLNPEPLVLADIATLRDTEQAFQNARRDKQTRGGAQTVADSNGRAFLGKARKAIALELGENWSAAWLPTGFPDQSTAVPDTQDARYALLGRLEVYFKDNPAVELPDKGVTADAAKALHATLTTARQAVKNQDTDLGTLKRARDAAETKLRTRLSHAIEELGQLLDDDDPTWHSFGLNRPGDPSAPEAVTDVVVTPTVPGTLFVDWSDTPRADRYRVWLLLVGVDTDFKNIVTRDESDATLAGLPSGATARIKITAAHGPDEGPASAIVEVKIP